MTYKLIKHPFRDIPNPNLVSKTNPGMDFIHNFIDHIFKTKLELGFGNSPNGIIKIFLGKFRSGTFLTLTLI